MEKLSFITQSYSGLSKKQLYELMQLRQLVFVVEQDCPYLDADGKDVYAHHILGYNPEDLLVAYARILEDPKWPGYISFGRVCTHPDSRRIGMGRTLMSQILEVIGIHYPKHTIRIGAQTYLIDFYASFGFQILGDTYIEDGIPHQDMIIKK